MDGMQNSGYASSLMRIRSKTLLVAACGALLMTGAWWGIVDAVIWPRFLALEQREANNHLQRLRQLLQGQRDGLLDKSGDWALWDDAFRFVQDGNQAFRDANLISTTCQSMRINQVAYLSFDGKIVGTGTCDLSSGKALTDTPLEHLDHSPDGPLLGPPRKGLKGSGFLSTPNGPVLVAFAPVLQSDGHGTSQAAVVFIRSIDTDKLREWSELLQLPLSWDSWKGPQPDIELLDSDYLTVHQAVRDLLDAPLATVSLKDPRDIAQIGQQSMLDLLWSGLGIAAILGALLAGALEMLVIRRLTRLAREVNGLDRYGVVTVDGHDEVTALANTILTTLNRATRAAADATLEQRRFAALFQRSADGILIIENGKIVEANHTALTLFGDHLVGRSYDDILPMPSGSHAAIRSHGTTTSPARELLLRGVNGASLPAEVQEAFIQVDGRDCVAVLVRDLRAQRAAEVEIRLLASVVDSTSDLVLVLSDQGRPHVANAALRHFLGGTITEPWAADLFADDQRDVMVAHLQSVHEESWRGDTCLRGDDHRPVSVVAFPIHDTTGQVTHLGLMMRDMRQEREREAAITQAREEAELAAQAKSTFLAVMSHELRTPLNGVIGMASLLTRTRLDQSQADYVNTIAECANSLLGQINDVLDLTRLEADGVELEHLELEIRTTAEEALTICAPRAGEKGIELGLMSEPLPILLGDPGRLRQILVNLIGNAVKFTDQGHILVRTTTTGTERLNIQIEDTGIGMPPEVLERLFTPFTQADSTMTRRYGGTGLGLVISRRLARCMGGDITVTSEPGRGSIFTVTLPLKPARVAAEAPPLPHLRVLLFEPRTIPSQTLEGLLREVGATIRRGTSSDAPQPNEVVIAPLDLPVGVELLTRHPGIGTFPLGATVTTPPGVTHLHRPIRRQGLLECLTRLQPVPPQAHPTSAWKTDPHILVVDDNTTNREMVKAMLELLGATAVEASNGQEALDHLNRETFSMVLMDGQMPVMDGFEAVRRWRSIEAARSLPRTTIIALTALAMTGDDARCRAAGMDDYLAKPFTVNRLSQILHIWIR